MFFLLCILGRLHLMFNFGWSWKANAFTAGLYGGGSNFWLIVGCPECSPLLDWYALYLTWLRLTSQNSNRYKHHHGQVASRIFDNMDESHYHCISLFIPVPKASSGWHVSSFRQLCQQVPLGMLARITRQIDCHKASSQIWCGNGWLHFINWRSNPRRRHNGETSHKTSHKTSHRFLTFAGLNRWWFQVYAWQLLVSSHPKPVRIQHPCRTRIRTKTQLEMKLPPRKPTLLPAMKTIWYPQNRMWKEVRRTEHPASQGLSINDGYLPSKFLAPHCCQS